MTTWVAARKSAYRKIYKPAIPNKVNSKDTAECIRLGENTTQKADAITNAAISINRLSAINYHFRVLLER